MFISHEDFWTIRYDHITKPTRIDTEKHKIYNISYRVARDVVSELAREVRMELINQEVISEGRKM